MDRHEQVNGCLEYLRPCGSGTVSPLGVVVTYGSTTQWTCVLTVKPLQHTALTEYVLDKTKTNKMNHTCIQ